MVSLANGYETRDLSPVDELLVQWRNVNTVGETDETKTLIRSLVILTSCILAASLNKFPVQGLDLGIASFCVQSWQVGSSDLTL